MNVNARTTRGRRKSSQCSPKRRGDDHYVVFLGENVDIGKKEGMEQWPAAFFAKKWRHFSLIARSEEEATTEVNVQLPRAARIVCTGRAAIEAHSSAIACTLFFITVLVPLARSGFNFKAISLLIYDFPHNLSDRFLRRF